MRPRLSRSIIALVAAYAVAFQALLAGFIVVSHAAGGVAGQALCVHHAGAANPDEQQPPGESGCPCGPACVMAGHAVATAVLARASTAIAWNPVRSEAVVASNLAPTPAPDPAPDSHPPRAPPPA